MQASCIILLEGEIDLNILVQIYEISVTLDRLLEVDHHGPIITLPNIAGQQSGSLQKANYMCFRVQ